MVDDSTDKWEEATAMAYDELPEVFEVSDRRVLRVITNPIRYAALSELFESHEPLTATQIADAVGVSPSVMSYHLRELGKVGIIHRVRGLRDGREAPWMPSAKQYRIVVSKEPSHEARMKLMDAVLVAMRDRIERMIVARARSRAVPPNDSSPYTMLSTGNLVLTEEEGIAAQQEVRAIWSKYERLSDGRKPGRYPVNAVYVWSCLPDAARDGGPARGAGAARDGGPAAARRRTRHDKQ